jgi:hypothetical protein
VLCYGSGGGSRSPIYVQYDCEYGKSRRGVASANPAMASCESRVIAACESAEMCTVVQYEDVLYSTREINC